MVPQKDVAGQGHALGEFVMSHGPLASWVEDLVMIGEEKGY
jgi:hypothetical protein